MTYREAIESTRMEIIETSTDLDGFEIWVGQIQLTYGMLTIRLGQNGCAKLIKPNKTVKWLYGKTPAQIAAILRQTIEANSY